MRTFQVYTWVDGDVVHQEVIAPDEQAAIHAVEGPVVDIRWEGQPPSDEPEPTGPDAIPYYYARPEVRDSSLLYGSRD